MPRDQRQELQAYIAQVYVDGELKDDQGRSRPIVPSGIALETGHALRDLIISEGAGRTLEVGFALGLSTLFICEALLAREPAGQHIAIDPLERSNFGSTGLLSLQRAGVSDLVEHREESSDLALPALLRDNRGAFDFALVDGAHWFDYAFLDAFFSMQLVRPGGIVVLDDTWMPGPRLAARYLVSNLGCTEVTGVLPQAMARNRAGLAQPHWPHLTALRTPAAGAFSRAEDAFAPFHDPPVPVTTRLAGLVGVARRVAGVKQGRS